MTAYDEGSLGPYARPCDWMYPKDAKTATLELHQAEVNGAHTAEGGIRVPFKRERRE